VTEVTLEVSLLYDHSYSLLQALPLSGQKESSRMAAISRNDEKLRVLHPSSDLFHPRPSLDATRGGKASAQSEESGYRIALSLLLSSSQQSVWSVLHTTLPRHWHVLPPISGQRVHPGRFGGRAVLRVCSTTVILYASNHDACLVWVFVRIFSSLDQSEPMEDGGGIGCGFSFSCCGICK